jgi:hypothetical protein
MRQVGHAVSVQPKVPWQFWEAFQMSVTYRLDQMAAEASVLLSNGLQWFRDGFYLMNVYSTYRLKWETLKPIFLNATGRCPFDMSSLE